ncbi:MAG: CYTH domain-containing protein [Candidatus Saccharibacteria bacterium]|nr:CYTH domain-containing protein [Candidatus Saccharibacteria bacterium]
MHNEIEAQFLDINKDEIRAKLKAIGAECVKPEVLMRRTVFYTGEHSYARVRDEGAGKIVMTYKNISDDHSILGTKEVNVVIDSYENGILFLKGCGLKEKAQQETYRETWAYKDVEICIDTWPWIPTFIEIEGPSEEFVWDTAEKLGLDRTKSKFGAVDGAYNHYYGVDEDVVNLRTPRILFDMTPPDWVDYSKLEKPLNS